MFGKSIHYKAKKLYLLPFALFFFMLTAFFIWFWIYVQSVLSSSFAVEPSHQFVSRFVHVFMAMICVVGSYMFIRNAPSEIVVEICDSKNKIKVRLLIGVYLEVQSVCIVRNDLFCIAYMKTMIGVVPVNFKRFVQGLALRDTLLKDIQPYQKSK